MPTNDDFDAIMEGLDSASSEPLLYIDFRPEPGTYGIPVHYRALMEEFDAEGDDEDSNEDDRPKFSDLRSYPGMSGIPLTK